MIEVSHEYAMNRTFHSPFLRGFFDKFYDLDIVSPHW
jgi:hypothetical protein